MNKLKLSAIAVSVAAALAAVPAHADLARVGPKTALAHFPAWFQDRSGVALEFCTPLTQTDLVNGNCFILPGDIPTGTAPETFPNNMLDEHFWYNAQIVSPLTNFPGSKLTFIGAVEAAFAADIQDGQQIVFSRIRLRLTNPPLTGDYRITHPYGFKEFIGVQAGDPKAIFDTQDDGVNCAASSDFSCALTTPIGPFLHQSQNGLPGGPAVPFVPITIGTDAQGKAITVKMLSDVATFVKVTGSPTGNNFVRLEYRPDAGSPYQILDEFQDFTLMGRLFDQPIPAPMAAQRATYSRDSSGVGSANAWIDVFATASQNIGNPNPPVLSVTGGGVDATTLASVQLPDPNPQTQTPAFRFWGQANITVPTGGIPGSITITNGSDTPPSTVVQQVVDAITIGQADYDPTAQQLVVHAESSDRFDPPVLRLQEDLSCASVAPAPLSCTLSNLAIPYPTVTVRSDRGGVSTLPVRVLKRAGGGGGATSIQGETLTTDEDVVANLDLAINDAGQLANSYRLVNNPAHGTVTITPAGTATYTPALNYFGADSFTYTFKDANQAGNPDAGIATVSITVNPVNDAPFAGDDSAATTQSTPINIPVLANDADPDTNSGMKFTPSAASVQVVTQPASGVATSQADGTIRYVPALAGVVTFTYRLIDEAGQASNDATVTVNVAANEAVSIATALFRTVQSRWVISGATNVVGGQTMSIYRNNGTSTGLVGGVPCATAPAAPTPACLLGTAVVDGLGNYAWDEPGSTKLPGNTNSIRVESPLGGRQTLGLTVRR